MNASKLEPTEPKEIEAFKKRNTLLDSLLIEAHVNSKTVAQKVKVKLKSKVEQKKGRHTLLG